MELEFKCIECHSTIKVLFNSNGNTITKTFFDQKSITKRSTDNYLWGGKYHLCPLLQCNQQKDFDKLITEGKIEIL